MCRGSFLMDGTRVCIEVKAQTLWHLNINSTGHTMEESYLTFLHTSMSSYWQLHSNMDDREYNINPPNKVNLTRSSQVNELKLQQTLWHHEHHLSSLHTTNLFTPTHTLVMQAALGKIVTSHLSLATLKNVLFPGPNHLLTTSADDLTLWLLPECQRVKGHQYWWLAGGYDLARVVVTWWIVALCKVVWCDVIKQLPWIHLWETFLLLCWYNNLNSLLFSGT